MKTTKKLEPVEVRRIRDRLKLSREELAARIEVDASTIKKWEDDERSCSGPTALLLRLLDRCPSVLRILDEPGGLPTPNVIDSTPEWFQMQRLLGLMLQRNNYGWGKLVQDEKLSVEWLRQMEDAELVRPDEKDTSVRVPTVAARHRFKLDQWSTWSSDQEFKEPRDVPVLNPATLEEALAQVPRIVEARHRRTNEALSAAFSSRRSRFAGY